MSPRFLLLVALCVIVPLATASDSLVSETTQVVLLGTGTPNPEPERSGPAVAIIVNDTAYLVDFGPGIVRRAAAMSPSEETVLEEVREKYSGEVVLGHDLDVY